MYSTSFVRAIDPSTDSLNIKSWTRWHAKKKDARVGSSSNSGTEGISERDQSFISVPMREVTAVHPGTLVVTKVAHSSIEAHTKLTNNISIYLCVYTHVYMFLYIDIHTAGSGYKKKLPYITGRIEKAFAEVGP